jgi:2-keto-3-deoxy-L-rhamnonate aldolase RhmA
MSDDSNPVRTWKSPFFAATERTPGIARSLVSGNHLRSKVNAGWAMGTFVIDLPDPSTITALSLAGFEFVVLDMEHSSVDFSRLANLVNAARAAGLACLVRPWGRETGLIGKILDLGAHGIMAPHVNSPEVAKQIVDQARFAPLGHRGFSPLTKFDALEEPLSALQESTYVVVQLEGVAAIERASEISAVPGIDAVFVGPYDLALSLGVEPGSEAVFDVARKMAAKVPDQLGLGIYIDDPSTCGDWARNGFALQCVGFDGRMLSDAARSLTKRAREAVASMSRE